MSNPIVARELIGVLRTRRAAVLQVGVAVLFTLIVLLRWPTDARVSVTGVQAMRVFRVFGYGLLATVILFVPVFPATSVVRERRSGTLALLLNSPLTPAGIYAGKLAGGLGFALVLLALSLPAAAACSTMGGGVTAGDVARLYGLLAVAAVQLTALALLVSTWARTADAALRITYGLVLAMTIAAPAPYLFFQGQEGVTAEVAGWLRSLSPVPAVMELLRQGGVGSQGVISETSPAARYVAFALAGGAVFAIWAIARLNHRLFDQSRSSGVMTEERGAGQRVVRRALFLVDPQRRKAGIGRFVNPVMVKEFRCRKFGRIHWLLRLVAVCATASLGLTYLTTAGTIDWGAETIGGILVILQSALILLITPSLAAVLISGELESGGWPLLQTTPLSAASILIGKLMSVVWTLALVLLATLPGYLVLVVIEPAVTRQVERVAVTLLLTALFSLAVGACVGSFFRRAAASTMAAYAVLLGWCGGTLLVWLGRDAPFGHSAVQAVLTVNPVAAALSVIDAPGFERYDLVPANWWFVAGASAVVLLVLTIRTWRLTRPR
jgi:ABC-type transport system involved in multi-copper enzyme maturation permease subunit